MTRALIALSIASLWGCAAAQKPPVAAAEPPPPAPVVVAVNDEAPAEAPPPVDEGPPSVTPLYYTLDSAQLSPESSQTLTDLADWLRSHQDASVKIDGHTCELGTSEYNLALGSQRAESARRYLLTLGVSPNQVDTASFGEERPAVSSEPERNRRSELHLSAR